jgi:uncharacterized phage protein (TIGR01671 family)
MREIEFRGLRFDGLEWIYGYPFFTEIGEALIFKSEDAALVKTVTIGQFTGLLDKFGNKIFEGDIIADKHGNKHTVFFRNGAFVAQYNNAILYLGQMYDHNKYLLYGINIDDKIDVKVIGNIHQNPELLAQ